jgi:uncharacterized OB-fold protein
MSTRPLPQPTGDSAHFWKACSEGQLTLQRCGACGRLQFYPRLYCAHCLSPQMTWEIVSGKGEVYSYSTIHRALSPAFKDQIPYVVAAIDLAEGPRMMTRLVDCAPEDVHIGMPVEVTFLRETEEIALPVFRPRKRQP